MNSMKNNSSKFDIYGYFYQTKINGLVLNFRSYLELKKKNTVLTTPDIMVVMMNPGGSEPKGGFVKKNFNKHIETVPDKTQEKIENFMLHYNYEFARVLNLSDYCNENSKCFYKKIPMLNKEYCGHSIFNDSRNDDFKNLFQKGIPIIIAWGVNSNLKFLASKAFKKIMKNNIKEIIGIKKENNDFLYYHPMRRISIFHPVSWIEEIKTKRN